MPPVCPRHGPSCPLSGGGKVCICCYFLPAIGALSGHWVLLEARVSLLAVPSHSSEVRRLGLYQPRWGGGFLFLPMALPSPEKNSSCHSRPRLCSQPVSHMAVWTPHKRLPLIFCEGIWSCFAWCTLPLYPTPSSLAPCRESLPLSVLATSSRNPPLTPLPLLPCSLAPFLLWGKKFGHCFVSSSWS